MDVRWGSLAGCIALCLLAGAIGSLFTDTGPGSWYEEIEKPAFTPPGWVFGPVWTVLYVLMGVSLYLALRAGLSARELWPFWAQLALNTLWSALFFGARSPWFAFACIVALWAMIALTIARAARASRPAAWLLAPYLVWVTFAAALNLVIALRN